MSFYSDGPCECSGQVRRYVLETVAIEVLGGVANPNLREQEAIGGRGWYRSKERCEFL